MQGKTVVEKIAETAGRIGLFAAALGLISSVITFFGYELRLLMWIEVLGPTMAWVFRGVLIVGGVGLFAITALFDKSGDPEVVAAAAAAVQEKRAATEAHPKVQQLLADLAPTMRVSFQETGDPETYVVRRVTFSGANGSHLKSDGATEYAPDDPQVKSLALFLERPQAPQRIVVGQMLASREITQSEANAAGWQYMVGT